MAEKRSYREFCAIARALDVVGERWTLLIVRELLSGPRRYKDLLAGLPGVGTNLLADRLRELEESGVIAHSTLPPPASSRVYSLTERGMALRSVVMNLGTWGAELAKAPAKHDSTRAWWSLLLLHGKFYASDAPNHADVVESYEIRADGEVFYVAIDHGRLSMGQGAANNPAFVLSIDGAAIASALGKKRGISDLIEDGNAKLEGDRKALKRFERIFELGDHRRR